MAGFGGGEAVEREPYTFEELDTLWGLYGGLSGEAELETFDGFINSVVSGGRVPQRVWCEFLNNVPLDVKERFLKQYSSLPLSGSKYGKFTNSVIEELRFAAGFTRSVPRLGYMDGYVDVLVAFAGDFSPSVREYTAMVAGLPDVVARILVEDESLFVLRQLTENVDTPSDVLERVEHKISSLEKHKLTYADQPSVWNTIKHVRKNIASHRNVPENVLRKYFTHDEILTDEWLRKNLYRNPSMGKSIISEYRRWLRLKREEAETLLEGEYDRNPKLDPTQVTLPVYNLQSKIRVLKRYDNELIQYGFGTEKEAVALLNESFTKLRRKESGEIFTVEIIARTLKENKFSTRNIYHYYGEVVKFPHLEMLAGIAGNENTPRSILKKALHMLEEPSQVRAHTSHFHSAQRWNKDILIRHIRSCLRRENKDMPI